MSKKVQIVPRRINYDREMIKKIAQQKGVSEQTVFKMVSMMAFCPCMTCAHMGKAVGLGSVSWACAVKHCAIDPMKPRNCGCWKKREESASNEDKE